MSSAQEELLRSQKDSDYIARLEGVLVADANDAARCAAAILLSDSHSSNTEYALIAALHDDVENVRRTAAISLVQIGSVRGLSAVVSGTRHGAGVRSRAALRLAEWKAEAAEAVPALMILLTGERVYWKSKLHAGAALTAIGDAAIPSLTHALLCGPSHSRRYAAIALQEINKTPELLPAIQEELRRAGLEGKSDCDPQVTK